MCTATHLYSTGEAEASSALGVGHLAQNKSVNAGVRVGVPQKLSRSCRGSELPVSSTPVLSTHSTLSSSPRDLTRSVLNTQKNKLLSPAEVTGAAPSLVLV